jgi:hypothetical protein
MFLGFVIIGLLVTTIGAAICVKGIKAISKDSLTPQRTLHTIKGEETPLPAGKEPSSAELHREALTTKQRIGEERQELRDRITPSQLKISAIEHIRNHPLSWGLVALVCALSGGYFIGRKFLRA